MTTTVTPWVTAEQALTEAAGTLRLYAGSEPFAQMVKLLDSLKAVYLHELADIKPEQLLFRQGALRQVTALHSAMTGEIGDSPRV